MRKLFLIKNPDLFQGKMYLKKNVKKDINYFEGWYFKNVCGNDGISFIPGINIEGMTKKAFIQVITNDESWFIDYDIDDFEYNYDPFWIRIGNNYFSKNRIHIDIKDLALNLNILGDLKYRESRNISRSLFSPNIMGIFSYIPFMECNHCILSMRNVVNGVIDINDRKLVFSNGVGYIEKDFGCSFPKSYVWLQGNCFKNSSSSFMLSIADIPFKLFNFRGLICSLIVNDKEYRFATYNNSKILKYDISDDGIDILLRKGKYFLEVKSKCGDGLMLKAPVDGSMKKEILESINGDIMVTLRRKKEIIFSDVSVNGGIEIVE